MVHMCRKLLFLTLLISFSAISQDTLNKPLISNDTLNKPLFSQEITKNIKKYVKKSQLAYHDNDYVHADFLYDSLVQHVIINSYLDNFKVKKRSGKEIELKSFEKPMILLSTASWCTPGAGTIPALIIAACFVVGGYIGSKFAVKVDQGLLKKIFAVILVVAAIKLFFGK